jgi:hypothetical protein
VVTRRRTTVDDDDLPNLTHLELTFLLPRMAGQRQAKLVVATRL